MLQPILLSKFKGYIGISKNAFCFIIEVDGKPVRECWLQRMNLKRILEKYPRLDCRRIDLIIGKKQFNTQFFNKN